MEDLQKAAHATIWGTGKYERIAETLAPMHKELVRHMRPEPGEYWLDLATGTGAVALLMARMGARVTGVDLSPVLIARAGIAAEHADLEIRFDVGDAECLDYPNAGFDGVVSAVGTMFAPDHRAVAHELARVCRPGGKIGLTAWRPDGGVGDFFEVSAQFRDPQPKYDASFEWGRDSYVYDLLGDTFELEVFDYDAPFIAPSSIAAWEILSTSYGPTMALAASLDELRRDAFRQAVIEFYDRFWTGSEVRHQRRYALYVGKRREQ